MTSEMMKTIRNLFPNVTVYNDKMKDGTRSIKIPSASKREMQALGIILESKGFAVKHKTVPGNFTGPSYYQYPQRIRLHVK